MHTWNDGRRYEGEFDHSQMHGRGQMREVSGRTYIGTFVHGQMTTRVPSKLGDGLAVGTATVDAEAPAATSQVSL